MDTQIQITGEQREILTSLLQEYIPGVAVWAYGSRIKGNAKRYSDLDLVAFATPDQASRVAALKDALDESNLPFLVDLHVWDDLPESFHAVILREHVLVQQGTADLKGRG